MKGYAFSISLCLAFGLEFALLVLLMGRGTGSLQDTVTVNEIVYTVQRGWGCLENHVNNTNFDYVVLGADGTVLYRTKPGLSESVHAAIAYRDTMLDVEVGGMPVGKLIVYNDDVLTLQSEKRTIIFAVAAAMLLQLGICAGYFCYLRRTIVAPFRKLERFAQRIAGGNLDIPLEMDRHNLFGAFTESFDLMRSQLKQARLAEAKAATAKRELVAKLPHLKEKFKRGANAKDIEGAGLGLYIADHCMREMGGRLELENGASGLKTVIWIALSRGI